MAVARNKKINDEEKLEEAKQWKQEVELRKEEDRQEKIYKQKMKKFQK